MRGTFQFLSSRNGRFKMESYYFLNEILWSMIDPQNFDLFSIVLSVVWSGAEISFECSHEHFTQLQSNLYTIYRRHRINVKH